MKKLKSISKITVFSLLLISLFAGCSNLAEADDSKNGGNEIADALTDSSKGAVKIKLGASPARYISAYDFNLSNFSTWTCSFKDENDNDAEEISISTSASSGTASLSYKDEILTAGNIPAGKYKVTITGTYAPSSNGDSTSTTYTISGSKSGVEIEQGKTASADIFVGMAKTGKGSLSLTLTDKTGKITETNYGTVSLCDLSGDVKYSTDDSKTLTAKYNDNGSDQSSTLTITGSEIASGWYKLVFYYDDSVRIYVSSDNAVIEIADGITTTNSETITLYAEDTKNYYATNDTSASGNGLATLSRINLSTLLENLAATLPDEGEIDIYVNGTPEIDLDKFALLKSEIAEAGTEKSIYIYNANESTETEAISLETTSSTNNDGTKTFTTTTSIKGALTLTAGTETTLYADKITVENNSTYTITLKGGAAMNITDTSGISGTLGICAVTSDGTTDNSNAYNTNTGIPFLTTTSIFLGDIAVYYANGEATGYKVPESTSDGIYTYTISSSTN